MTPPSPSHWSALALLGVIWGGSFMGVAIALEGYGPVTVAAARTTLGAVALLVLARLLGRRLPLGNRELWPWLLAIGLVSSVIPFFLLAWGVQHVGSAFAGLTMAALPLFVLPLAHVFTDDRLTRQRVFGFLVGFAGAMALIAPGLPGGAGGGPLETLARFACLGAAISYAASSVLTRLCPPIDPVALAALALSVGALVLGPAALLLEGAPGWQGTRPVLALLALGLVPTGVAAVLRVWLVRSAGPGFMSLVNYQVPVWAILFGALVLNETLPARFFAALALILAGLWVAQRRAHG